MRLPADTQPKRVGVQFGKEDIAKSLEFTGPTAVGGLFDSTEVENGAAYFSGYVLMKLNEKHLKISSTSISNCTTCSALVTEPNLTFHLFNTFKEYSDSHNGLFYCSQFFVDCIVEYERVFLYFLNSFGHVPGFCSAIVNVYTNHCSIPKMCNSELVSFLLNFFVRCRTFQSLKVFNRSLISPDQTENKVNKLTHN